MIKISVEGQTTLELSLKLLEIGRRLAAEPVPEAKPTKQRKTPAPAPAVETKTYPDGATAAGPAPLPDQSPVEIPPENEVSNDKADLVKQMGAPAVDSEAVRAELRALLSGLVRAGKQPAVNELVTSYAPALSQVPADKLVELKQKAEAL